MLRGTEQLDSHGSGELLYILCNNFVTTLKLATSLLCTIAERIALHNVQVAMCREWKVWDHMQPCIATKVSSCQKRSFVAWPVNYFDDDSTEKHQTFVVPSK